MHQSDCIFWLMLRGLAAWGLLTWSRCPSCLYYSSMSFRIVLAAVLALACGSALAAVPNPAVPKPAVPKPRPAPIKLPEPLMRFYMVKGASDACGRGCDSWIAVEGKIDSAAAARFKKFLARVRGRNLPIYFNSPGGNLEQALAMGAMLREKPVIARVGRTVVSECGFEAQDDEACIKLKQAGRELHGDIFTRGAFCGSACPYLILGAATREVAADAALAVHSAKVTVSFRGPGVPPAEMIAAADARAYERSDRMLAAYVTKMGADTALLALVRTVKFEQVHILTREEIVRFGIDRREFVETPWTFEPGTRAMVHKAALERREGDKTFHALHWRIICIDSDQFEFGLLRPAMPNPMLSSVSVSIVSAPLFLLYSPSKLSEFEFWRAPVPRASVQSLSDAGQTELTETSPTADGHRAVLTQKLSIEGFADGLNKLLATCPAPQPPRQQTVEARDHAAK
jgi:hypothetical protein